MLSFDPILNVCPTNPNNYLLYISTNRAGAHSLKAEEKSFWNLFKLALLNLFGQANSYKFKTITSALSSADLSKVDRQVVQYINSRIRSYNKKHTDVTVKELLKPTRQLYERLKEQEFSLKEMEEQQLIKLLEKEPLLKEIKIGNKTYIAFGALLDAYKVGIPTRIHNSASNVEFMQQVRYIIHHISQQKSDETQRKMLIELVNCFEGCVADAQGKLRIMFQKCMGLHGDFGLQLDVFIALARDKALDETIYELFPEMQGHEYLKNHPKSQDQFPHVKTGFLAVFGDQIGLDGKMASEDRHCNKDLARSKNVAFIETFKNKLNINGIIKSFIIEINGMHNDTIENFVFMKWCGKNELGPQSMYDETSFYIYSPDPNQQQLDYCAAYITEQTAIETFRKMGYLE